MLKIYFIHTYQELAVKWVRNWKEMYVIYYIKLGNLDHTYCKELGDALQIFSFRSIGFSILEMIFVHFMARSFCGKIKLSKEVPKMPKLH